MKKSSENDDMKRCENMKTNISQLASLNEKNRRLLLGQPIFDLKTLTLKFTNFGFVLIYKFSGFAPAK